MQAYVVQTWGTWDDDWQQARFRQHFAPTACQTILDQKQAIGVFSVEAPNGYLR